MILVALFAFTFCSLMAQNDNLADKVTINQTSLNIIKQDIEFPDEAVGYLTDPEGKMIALDCIDPKTAKKKHPNNRLIFLRDSISRDGTKLKSITPYLRASS